MFCCITIPITWPILWIFSSAAYNCCSQACSKSPRKSKFASDCQVGTGTKCVLGIWLCAACCFCSVLNFSTFFSRPFFGFVPPILNDFFLVNLIKHEDKSYFL